MQWLRQILGIAVLNGKWILRQPLWIFQSFIGVIGLTITLFAWGSSLALSNLVVAYLVIGSWGLGLNIVAQTIGWNRVGHVYESYVASPITLPIYFLGTILGSMPFFSAHLSTAIVISILSQMDLAFIPLALLLSLISLILGAFLSLSIILRLRNPTNISAITNPLNTLTTILPPIYYPLSFLQPVLRNLALAVPTVPLMEIGRWLAAVPTGQEIVLSLTSLIIWTVIVTILVAKKLRWGLE
jgi:ABC-2 type transport system permease protein